MNQNNQRLMITVALCMVVALAWSYLFNPAGKHPPGKPGGAVTAPAPEGAAPAAAPGVPGQPAAGLPGGATSLAGTPDVPRGTPSVPRHPTERVTLESGLVRAVLTSDG